MAQKVTKSHLDAYRDFTAALLIVEEQMKALCDTSIIPQNVTERTIEDIYYCEQNEKNDYFAYVVSNYSRDLYHRAGNIILKDIDRDMFSYENMCAEALFVDDHTPQQRQESLAAFNSRKDANVCAEAIRENYETEPYYAGLTELKLYWLARQVTIDDEVDTISDCPLHHEADIRFMNIIDQLMAGCTPEEAVEAVYGDFSAMSPEGPRIKEELNPDVTAPYMVLYHQSLAAAQASTPVVDGQDFSPDGVN